ncbi:TetR/AcrR family transcriptional regulator [Brachybacterium sp. YJGR34]|uniref:TetR/AcrR family transcriptional regulator n=1 Tax=Brachybacterium sp. YJGR34 TaxID=2059911 RepID=UPI002101A4A7|nr:TetR/AcrR family transcriptional regulator [Brachybacterium sp. YJGR34]
MTPPFSLVSSRRRPGAASARGRAPVTTTPRPARPSRREAILDGASEMFAEHGYFGSSLRKIAQHIGISHPGMLHHFPTKADLLIAVIERLEERAQGVLDHVDELCLSSEALLEALATTWDPCSPSIRLFATLDAEAVSREHPGRFRLARLHRVHEHVLEQCFRAMRRHGTLREDIDPAFAGRSMLALVLSHACREGTVRTMQGRAHDDAPVADLHKLLQSYRAPSAPASTLVSGSAVGAP